MSQITTHVLNTSLGVPATAVPLCLSQFIDGQWMEIAVGDTDRDGRVGDLLKTSQVLAAGHYRMRFDTAHYFETLGTESFYPWVEIVFSIGGDGQHYHIPLLLSPFGYSTYRGS